MFEARRGLVPFASLAFLGWLRAEGPTTATIQGITVHFETEHTALIEIQGQTIRIDLARKSAESVAAPEPEPAAPAVQEVPGLEEDQYKDPFEERKPLTDRANRLINLPTTKPQRKGGLDFWLAHRFARDLFAEGSFSDLFGLDSTANIVFGVDVGLTDHWRIGGSRSRFDKIIEFSTQWDILQQGKRIPLSLMGKVGLEGRDNFHNFYSPYVQFSVSRNVGDRFEGYLVPTLILNARDDRFPDEFLQEFGIGVDRDYTFSFGLGGSVQVLPTVYVTGEWVPRLAGFRGLFVDRPTVSLGIQKQTWGHVFQLVLSTSTGTTPGQYAINATDAFKIGFNVFRRLRK